jgi:hypothetical protein
MRLGALYSRIVVARYAAGAIAGPVMLSPEQRLALARLATAGRDGATQSLLSAPHGFRASMIAGLVNRGMATLAVEKVRAGGKPMAVGKVTDHDRRAGRSRSRRLSRRWRKLSLTFRPRA